MGLGLKPKAAAPNLRAIAGRGVEAAREREDVAAEIKTSAALFNTALARGRANRKKRDRSAPRRQAQCFRSLRKA